MDHPYRGIREGLIVLDEIPIRRSRDEFKIIVDPYAAQAIRVKVPYTLRQELEGWARSYYSLDKHIEAIMMYRRPKLPQPSDDCWNQTKQFVLTYFRRLPKLETLSFKDFDAIRWISSSAAGYGYVGRKGDNDNYDRAKRIAVTISEKLNHDTNYMSQAILESTPDIAFTRTQLSLIKVKTKVRNVWGEAFHYVLLEGLFAEPLINRFKDLETFYFIGKDPLLAVPALIEEILSAKDYVYMFDWSGFDASVQEWEIRFAFECLESMLIFPSTVETQIWRFVIELFIYRKIAGPNGVLYLKTQGIPSGSCFTNIIGSITNFVRIQYMFKRLTNRFAEVYTHGDDSLAGVDLTQYVPMERFSEVCDSLFWSINTAKSAVSRRDENISFLSRTVRERQNTRDELTCLRMLMYPEYNVLSGDVSATRAKSIYLDAGINSHYLYVIYRYLKERYGIAQALPFEQRRWDPIEYEARKVSASEIM
uniref:RdRp n=1 Tax=Pistacia cryptic virus TaxID=2794235 RepID=A0A7T0M8F0_9VIRU|nr:RdRp [Pistacia cryptic virus]